MSAESMAAPSSGYPVRFDVEYPERLSRLLNNPFLFWIKWILAIPHLIILYILGLLLYIVVIIASFAILFTGKYPRGLFDFAVGIGRWSANVYAYIFLMRDEYPPFSMDTGAYPVTWEVDYPPSLSRWLNFLLLVWIKWILLIPHIVILYLLYVLAFIVGIIASFAILFTGNYPKGMFDFVVGVMRWWLRVYSYGFYLFTDAYPPFSIKP